MKRIVAVAALLIFTAVVDAACPTLHRQAVVKQQAVVAPVVQALAVAVPAYGAGYAPPQQTADAETLRQLLEEIRAMRAELRAALQQAQQQPQAVDAGALAGSVCARCHQASQADARGGGFVMVEDDGSLSVLSLEHRNRIRRRIENGSMPPPRSASRPLTDGEKKSLVEFFTKNKE